MTEVDLLKWLESLPEDPDEATRLGTMTKDQVEVICADIFQKLIEDMQEEKK